MYQRILVPVDGSRFSEQLIGPAAEVARATGARLALLRVVDHPDEQATAQRELQALATPFQADALCVTTTNGSVATAIGDEARRVPQTLVAMCSHGRSGTLQAVFGSVALQVLGSLGKPLVVFRPRAGGPRAASRIEQIVLPLDGSAVSEAIIPQAAAFAKWLSAKVVVVSVLDPALKPEPGVPAGDVQESSYVRSIARDIGDRHGVAVSWEVLRGDPKEAIPTWVRGLEHAMLAMTTHGRSGLRSLMAGSVMAQCLRDADVPIYTRLP